MPDRAQLLDAKGNVREGIAREWDTPAGFARFATRSEDGD
jgi:hypothetical protein